MKSWSAPSIPELPGTGPTVRLLDQTTGELRDTVAPGAQGRLYVCGITPYDATHIGHASTYLGFDLLVRAWRDAGVDVKYVQNVTDIDDPLLERAEATGVAWQDLAAEQTDLFRADMAALRIVPPVHYIGAVESIDLVVDAVERLLELGAAYRIPTPEATGSAGLGDVYADLSADPSFAVALGWDAQRLLDVFGENGGDPDRLGKRHPLDPLLWRRSRAGEPSWDGRSLGTGRPGWHIECAVIAATHLGLPVDVQGGGRDLVFPHHEMSTSHLRVLSGSSAPCRIHRVAGLVAYDGEKMSKSRGNLVFVSQLIAQGADPMTVRVALLARHHGVDWEFTTALLDEARQRLQTWQRALGTRSASTDEARRLLDQVRAALAHDLDSPAALAAVDAWADRTDDHAVSVEDPAGTGLVRDTLDALLGIRL